LALIHYQFEVIHPFMDGNGRLGRLLITLLLCAEGHLPQPLLYLSAYFERHRDAYLDHLLLVSRRGAWAKLIIFFLQGVAEQAADAVRRARLLLDLQVNYRQRLQTSHSSSLPIQLADTLFTNPAITLSMATRALEVTPRAARQNVEKLAAAGILREYPNSSRPRVYICEEIMSIIEAVEV
ncbi:MAG: Fic family protein, partial [Chloroflexota bacterium]